MAYGLRGVPPSLGRRLSADQSKIETRVIVFMELSALPHRSLTGSFGAANSVGRNFGDTTPATPAGG